MIPFLLCIVVGFVLWFALDAVRGNPPTQLDDYTCSDCAARGLTAGCSVSCPRRRTR